MAALDIVNVNYVRTVGCRNNRQYFGYLSPTLRATAPYYLLPTLPLDIMQWHAQITDNSNLNLLSYYAGHSSVCSPPPPRPRWSRSIYLGTAQRAAGIPPGVWSTRSEVALATFWRCD
jgi:hypothetical protein